MLTANLSGLAYLGISGLLYGFWHLWRGVPEEKMESDVLVLPGTGVRSRAADDSDACGSTRAHSGTASVG